VGGAAVIRLAAWLVALWASAAAAFELPAFYAVRDVAPDDVLNVRAAPSVAAEVIGTLAPDARNIEVTALSADGRWGEINVDERSGWTSMRFLTRTAGMATPLRAQCFGTEPFWSLTIDGNATFDSASGADFTFGVTAQVSSANRTDRRAVLGRGPIGGLSATIAAQSCSDGMSDRAYGLSIDAVLDLQTGGPRLISGCCSLLP